MKIKRLQYFSSNVNGKLDHETSRFVLSDSIRRVYKQLA